jgi:choline/glycine/proline betaine transport protein
MPTPLTDAAPWMRILWSAVIGLLTLAMLVVGGLDALQQATIIMGLPFSFVMLAVMWGLYKAVRTEWFRVEAARTSLPMRLSGRTPAEPSIVQHSWQQRLGRSLDYPGRQDASRFLREVCRPALQEVASELQAQGIDATLTEGVDDELGIGHLDLQVPMNDEEDFVYQVFPRAAPLPSHAADLVDRDGTYIRFEVHLPTGSQEYDVMGYDLYQLIADVVDQYERHLEYLRLQREAGAGR